MLKIVHEEWAGREGNTADPARRRSKVEMTALLLQALGVAISTAMLIITLRRKG
jgi:hypothetical protein